LCSKTASRETAVKTAVGIVRVSRIKGEGIVSPIEQRERIEGYCEREGMNLVDTFEEPDVSGGAALEHRPGLSRALAMVETGEVDTIVVAYFDRLVRSIAVQAELVSRVEAAGGGILAVDVGKVTNGSAGQWLSGNVLGLVAEYQRRTTAERTEDAKRRAIERGVPTYDRIPVGLRQRKDRTLEHDPATKRIVEKAFRMRLGGSSIAEIRAWMRSRGVDVSYTAVQGMLKNRIYLGELRFGQYMNPTAVEPIIDLETFASVQKMRLPRGRKPKSDRLLARIGVLRCGTCGARMIVGQARANGRDYPMYRCPPNGDCPRRVTVSATIAENTIIEAVQDALQDVHGRASVEDGVAEAERSLEAAEQELDAAVEAFSALDDVAAAREKLTALRDVRGAARERVEELRAATVPSITVSAGDWNTLTLDEKRALIRAVVSEATVAPGRGADRIRVQTFSE
jgi:DNA invertase Pin-like site-specific DNA recombinase